MENYIIRTSNGVEIGPMHLDQLKELVKQGRVKATTMMSTQSSGHWHFAASFSEVREILQKYRPAEASTIDRIRVTNLDLHSSSRSKKSSSVRKSSSKNRKSKTYPLNKTQTVSPPGKGAELYTIRTGDGMEYGPLDFENVKKLVKEGHVKATTMVCMQSTNHWHLAASISEIRALLRKYVPSQNSALDRLRALRSSPLRDSGHLTASKSSSTHIKKSFWKRLFSPKS